MAKKAKAKEGAALELEQLKKKIGDNTPSEAQAKQLKELAEKAKKEKFVSVANVRIPKAMKAVALLKNLGGSAYRNTQAQREAIVQALQKEVDGVNAALNPDKSGADTSTFKLPS